ncbi:MAG: tetratricopeptide repeat protein [Polyangiaceae bacterium]|nr:tetratricopeptide repeat protein [Polyangiaceae bacterium]
MTAHPFRNSTLAALLFLLGSTSVAQAADAPISEKARAQFRAGVNYLKDPDGARYEEAYRAFKAAYADSPSWKILGNLGLAAMKLERDGEAIDAFEKYLKEGGSAVEEVERAQMQRDQQTLQASVVRVTITAPKGAHLTDERVPVSGRDVVNEYQSPDGKFTLGLRPGRHRITAELAGFKKAVWEIDTTAGSSHAHEFKLEAADADAPKGGVPVGPTTRRERPVPTLVWVGLGVSGALLAGAGVTGLMAKGKRSDFDAKNDGSDTAGADELKKDGERLNLITDGLLAGGVVVGAISVVALLGRSEVEVPVKEQARFRFSPTVARGGAGLWMTGAF